MKKCLYCWLIEPIPESFVDSSESSPAFVIPIHVENVTARLALFVDRLGLPRYVRMELPGLEEEAIPERFTPLLQATKEHLLSVLRAVFDPEIRLFPYALWSFVEQEQEDYKWTVDISRKFGPRAFDVQRAQRVFTQSWRLREEFRLLVDGLDERIPVQYRYLSLYKLLEVTFKDKNRWRRKDLEGFLNDNSPAFIEAGVTQNLYAHLHNLRNKCAHIKTGKMMWGVTSLNVKELVEVNRFINPLILACTSLIETRTDGQLTIRPIPWG